MVSPTMLSPTEAAPAGLAAVAAAAGSAMADQPRAAQGELVTEVQAAKIEPQSTLPSAAAARTPSPPLATAAASHTQTSAPAAAAASTPITTTTTTPAAPLVPHTSSTSLPPAAPTSTAPMVDVPSSSVPPPDTSAPTAAPAAAAAVAAEPVPSAEVHAHASGVDADHDAYDDADGDYVKREMATLQEQQILQAATAALAHISTSPGLPPTEEPSDVTMEDAKLLMPSPSLMATSPAATDASPAMEPAHAAAKPPPSPFIMPAAAPRKNDAAAPAPAASAPMTTPAKTALSRAILRSAPVTNGQGDVTRCPCGDNADQEGFMIQCLTVDHEIMTDRGFMSFADLQQQIPHLIYDASGDQRDVTPRAFLESVDATKQPADGGSLLIASFDPSSGHLVYLPPVVVSTKTVPSLIEFTHHAEAPRWADDADQYGLTPLQQSRMAAHSELPEMGDLQDELLSNGVSVVVDPLHDMFVRRGVASHARCEDHVAWEGDEADHARLKQRDSFTKVKAATLLSKCARRRVKFLSAPPSGVAAMSESVPFASALGMDTTEQVAAFLQLYGYWLGLAADSDRSRVRFASTSRSDQSWLTEQLHAAGLPTEEMTLDGLEVHVNAAKWVAYFHDGIDRESTRGVKHPDNDGFCSWMWSLSKGDIRLVLSGLRRATGSDQTIIHTSSVHFRDEVVRAAMHGGYSARFFVDSRADSRLDRVAVPHQISWSVAYSDDHKATEPVLFSARDVKSVQRSDGVKVWCPTVPPHGLIVARRVKRDGAGVVTQSSRPIIIGQCEACEIWQHGNCIGLTEKTTPEQYYCELCDRDNTIHQQFRRLWGDKTPIKGKVTRHTCTHTHRRPPPSLSLSLSLPGF